MRRVRIAPLLVAFAALGLGSASAAPRLVAPRVTAPVTSAPVVAGADPCIQCGVIYAVDFSPNFGDTNFWTIDPDAGTATWIGRMDFPMYFDIGISAAGELYGLTATEDLQRIDACTFAFPPPQVALIGGNSLGGDVTGDDLYVAGAPPLGVYDTVADTVEYRGSFPTNWCDAGGGILTGDLAMSPDPANGKLYGTMTCAGCSGDALVAIDPATGDMVDEVGCIQDASGVQYANVYGLAFDHECRLFGVPGPAFTPGDGSFILEIDTATGQATRIDLTSTNANIWGEPFNGANGLASVPCAPCAAAPAVCDPNDHGWWHRECLGAGLIDPGRRGRGRGPGLSPRWETYPATTFAASDADMADHGVLACQALDEGPNSDPEVAAERELATIYLNVNAGFLSLTCPVELHPVVEGDDLTVADAIQEMENRFITGTPADLRDARWIGEHVVNGEALR